MSQQCKTVLDNGMTVISRTMPDVRSVSLGLWFNVGSRDERPDQAGLTHFMEHMMFKGTPTKGPLDISMHFDRLGAELNAFTSKNTPVTMLALLMTSLRTPFLFWRRW